MVDGKEEMWAAVFFFCKMVVHPSYHQMFYFHGNLEGNPWSYGITIYNTHMVTTTAMLVVMII